MALDLSVLIRIIIKVIIDLVMSNVIVPISLFNCVSSLCDIFNLRLRVNVWPRVDDWARVWDGPWAGVGHKYRGRVWKRFGLWFHIFLNL